MPLYSMTTRPASASLGQLGKVLGVQLGLVLQVVEGHAGEGELLLVILFFSPSSQTSSRVLSPESKLGSSNVS